MNKNEQLRVRRQRLLEELAQLEQIRRSSVVKRMRKTNFALEVDLAKDREVSRVLERALVPSRSFFSGRAASSIRLG